MEKTAAFWEFKALLCHSLYERVERIRENYRWLCECALDDAAAHAAENDQWATIEDVATEERMRREYEEKFDEYCAPLIKEHEMKVRSLVDWFRE